MLIFDYLTSRKVQFKINSILRKTEFELILGDVYTRNYLVILSLSIVAFPLTLFASTVSAIILKSLWSCQYI